MTEEDRPTQVLPQLEAGPAPRVRRHWPWVIAVALVVAVGGWIWVRDDDQTTVRFKTQEVRRGDLTVMVTATGNLEPTNQVDVGSELSGTVKTVTVDFNDHVKVGQVLATLDTSKLDKQVQESRAALQVAQARVLDAKAGVMEARANLDRLSKMQKLGSSLVSEQDLVTARAAFARAEAAVASAKAQVAQAQATLDGAETDRAKAVIYSPINGIVLKRAIEPGQTVAASLQAPVLFTLAEDLTRMELHVDVDEADVSKVREGQEATFTVDAYPERRFQARVAEVRFGSETVGGVVTYKTVLKVDNTDLSLRPGMTATADIAVNHVSDVVLVPNAALRFVPPASSAQENQQRRSFTSLLFPRPPRRDTERPRERAGGSKQRVWVLQGGVPVAVPVTTGMTDGTMTQIVSGDLSPGTAVVVDTATNVR